MFTFSWFKEMFQLDVEKSVIKKCIHIFWNCVPFFRVFQTWPDKQYCTFEAILRHVAQLDSQIHHFDVSELLIPDMGYNIYMCVYIYIHIIYIYTCKKHVHLIFTSHSWYIRMLIPPWYTIVHYSARYRRYRVWSIPYYTAWFRTAFPAGRLSQL